MAYKYSKSLYYQYEEVLKELNEHKKLLKETNKLVSNLNATIKSLNETIEKQNKIIEEQAQEILRLKSKNNKDSSNSSKPSGTNGYKKVITNRREKSNNKKGAQVGYEPHSLNNKLEQFIKSWNVQEEIIEINKNENNKNKRYIEKIVIDIKVTKHIKRYRYYIHEDGKYHIPKCHNQCIQYPVVSSSGVYTPNISLYPFKFNPIKIYIFCFFISSFFLTYVSSSNINKFIYNFSNSFFFQSSIFIINLKITVYQFTPLF